MSMIAEYVRLRPNELVELRRLLAESPDDAYEYAGDLRMGDEDEEVSSRGMDTDKAWAALQHLLRKLDAPVDVIGGGDPVTDDEWGYDAQTAHPRPGRRGRPLPRRHTVHGARPPLRSGRADVGRGLPEHLGRGLGTVLSGGLLHVPGRPVPRGSGRPRTDPGLDGMTRPRSRRSCSCGSRRVQQTAINWAPELQDRRS